METWHSRSQKYNNVCDACYVCRVMCRVSVALCGMCGACFAVDVYSAMGEVVTKGKRGLGWGGGCHRRVNMETTGKGHGLRRRGSKQPTDTTPPIALHLDPQHATGPRRTQRVCPPLPLFSPSSFPSPPALSFPPLFFILLRAAVIRPRQEQKRRINHSPTCDPPPGGGLATR